MNAHSSMPRIFLARYLSMKFRFPLLKAEPLLEAGTPKIIPALNDWLHCTGRGKLPQPTSTASLPCPSGDAYANLSLPQGQ
eukprot:751827-Pelagomonas_calceolata.AAC.1